TGATAEWFSGSCGGTAVGTGNSITVSPGSNTTYFVRYAGTCNTTACASVAVTVNTPSVAPTAITGSTTIWTGGSTTLTLSGGSAGTGATAQWFSGSCGSTVIGTGNSITVSPGSATTYFVNYAGSCNTTACAFVPVTVNPVPAAFTPLISTSTPVCYRGNAEITVASSVAGLSYQLRDNTTNIGSAQAGTGSTLTFRTDNLTATSTTYNILATAGAGCTLSVNVPAISVAASATSLANNNDTRTCYVNGNNAFVEFAMSGRSIIAVNPGTQDLGLVTVTEYVNGTPVNIQACNTNSVTQPEFNSAALSRHWVITSSNPPVTPVNVRLYLADGDVSSLAASANFNVNPDDDVSGIGSLKLSRYSGPNENATFSDNCNTGGNTYLHAQSGNGTITAGISGNAIAGASYVTYTVNGFSEWWLSGTGATSPLPIVLGSFNAECAKGGVEIRWTTMSEVNNAYFTIERSADAEHWELVREISGAGNSNTLLNYSITDDRPLNGISYYRLRQTDHNGDNETFAPQSVTCFGNAQNGLLIYPNPSNDYFVLNFSTAADMAGSVELMDMTGRRVAIQNGSWQSGMNSFTFKDLAAFLPGAYTLRISGEGKVLYTAPVIIKR
ncbi:MAG: T9SS type A sorting domain-containing protein, partial [Flavobacteriales bacterium]